MVIDPVICTHAPTCKKQPQGSNRDPTNWRMLGASSSYSKVGEVRVPLETQVEPVKSKYYLLGLTLVPLVSPVGHEPPIFILLG